MTASRMVQAQGGTIEPLLYALLLWMLRRRAVAFGLLFAFGFLQREFTLFAVVAIVVLEAWTGELLHAAPGRALAASCCSCSSARGRR